MRKTMICIFSDGKSRIKNFDDKPLRDSLINNGVITSKISPENEDVINKHITIGVKSSHPTLEFIRILTNKDLLTQTLYGDISIKDIYQ